MDVQEPRRAVGVFNRRFFAHNTMAHAENRGAAVIYSTLTLLVSLLFARTHALFGAYPFAIAYLCAVDRRVPFAFLGGLLGAFSLGERGYAYAVVYLFLLCLRLFLSYPRGAGRFLSPCAEFFEEEAALRAASACVAGLFLSVYELIAGGLSATSLAFAAAILLLPVAFCMLYLGYFTDHRSLLFCLVEEETSPRRAADWWLSLSLGSLAFTLVRGVETVSLLGISLSISLSAFFCLLLPQRWGLLRGGAAAAIAALGACLSTVNVVYLPAFLAMAAAGGLLARLGARYALLGAAAAGGLVSYVLAGVAAVLSFLPELCVCLAVAWPLLHALPRLRGARETEGERARNAAQAAVRAMAPGGQRMVRFADAFSSLAEVFSRLASGSPRMENGRVRGDRNEILEGQFRMTAALLQDAAAREEREAREDAAVSLAALRVFEEMGAGARQVSVFGSRARLLLASGVRWEADHPEERALRARLEKVCGCTFAAPVLSLRGGVTDMRYTAARRLAISAHTAGVARGREVSGDVFSTFSDEEGRYYALLSDGMGSGREAAITAGICGSFLSGVLGAGAGKKRALEALNLLLAEREGECTATVDLCEIDLLTGNACFLKCGAASSYVRRGESLFHIPAGRLPLGMPYEVDVEKTKFPLQAGDRVILLSDGVSQSPEDALWLCELLSDRWEDEPDVMTDRILHAARAHAAQNDDMTVAILYVEKA